MAVRKFKPVTPGQRNKVISAFDDITCKKPEKSLLTPLKKSGGRNNQGKMTMRYIGGGHKRMYRIIDFLRDKDECTATVMTIEYDPNRSARIALVKYEDGEKRYIIAPNGLKVGQVIASGAAAARRSATLFLSLKFRLVHLFTTLSSALDRVPQWHVQQELMLSSQPVRASMLFSVSLQARQGWCLYLAVRLWEQCPILTTIWSLTEKLDAEDGSAAGLVTAVL